MALGGLVKKKKEKHKTTQYLPQHALFLLSLEEGIDREMPLSSPPVYESPSSTVLALTEMSFTVMPWLVLAVSMTRSSVFPLHVNKSWVEGKGQGIQKSHFSPLPRIIKLEFFRRGSFGLSWKARWWLLNAQPVRMSQWRHELEGELLKHVFLKTVTTTSLPTKDPGAHLTCNSQSILIKWILFPLQANKASNEDRIQLVWTHVKMRDSHVSRSSSQTHNGPLMSPLHFEFEFACARNPSS